MAFNYFYPIIQILPAIIGFLITGVLVLKFVHCVKIPEYNENPPEIIISSFIFILSGFIFQIIYSDWSSIQNWAKDNASISFIFTILGTFSINRFLKKLADDKEKREIAVLLRNSIDAQVTSLKFINMYLSLSSPKKYVNYIQIYKNDLIGSKFYITALNKIGIYNEKDIDIIHKYSIELQQCFNYIERFLIELNEDIKVNITHINQINYQHQYERTLKIVKTAIVTTSLFGILISYYLSKIYLKGVAESRDDSAQLETSFQGFQPPIHHAFMQRHLKNNLEKLQNKFFDDYKEILDGFLEKELELSFSSIMDGTLSSDLFNKLKDTSDLFNKLKDRRNRFIRTNNYFNVQERKSIYLCRLPIEQFIDFDKYIYINKHFSKEYINSKDYIVTFGESLEDAENNCKKIINSLKQKHCFIQEFEIKNAHINCKCEIVSPWTIPSPK